MTTEQNEKLIREILVNDLFVPIVVILLGGVAAANGVISPNDITLFAMGAVSGANGASLRDLWSNRNNQ